MSLKLYGFMISQPTRAAAWLLKVKALPFQFEHVHPPKDLTPEFLAMNPNGLVPVIKDGDFTLFEGNAIMAYLADKHKWTDVYPTDLQARAKVNEYLNWHHSHSRHATTRVLRPLLLERAGKATPATTEDAKNVEATLDKSVKILEKFFVKPYVAQSEQPTIADYACYCEFDQIEAMDIFDFSKYPKTADWMKRMKEIPHHDEVRTDMNGFLSKFDWKA